MTRRKWTVGVLVAVVLAAVAVWLTLRDVVRDESAEPVRSHAVDERRASDRAPTVPAPRTRAQRGDAATREEPAAVTASEPAAEPVAERKPSAATTSLTVRFRTVSAETREPLLLKARGTRIESHDGDGERRYLGSTSSSRRLPSEWRQRFEEPGAYDVTISSKGYLDALVKGVTVLPDREVAVDVPLVPDPAAPSPSQK